MKSIGVEHDISGAVTEGVLESIHDLCAVIDGEAFVRYNWAGDVATLLTITWCNNMTTESGE